MLSSIDHIIIAVKDLDEAEKNYEKILGISPVWKGEHEQLGTRNVLFNFTNIYLELINPNSNGPGSKVIKNHLKEKAEGLIGMAYGSKDINQIRAELIKSNFDAEDIFDGEGINLSTKEKRGWKNLFLPNEITRGALIFVIQHIFGSLKKTKIKNNSGVRKLDHVVINTNDAEGFIKIHRDFFKIRLALDKIIEHWDRRMLFFRLNKTTLEVVETKNKDKPSDSLWGLAWEVDSIQSAYKRLKNEGVEVSDIKPGIKEGTKVLTIKSHTNGVPTLLIEHQK